MSDRKPGVSAVPAAADEPIVVSPSAGVFDLLTALMRYVVVIAAAVPTLKLLIGQHDLIGLINWFESDAAKPVIAAIIAIGTIAYGLYKTHLRGSQIATVAADRRVPDQVAQIK